MRNTVEIGLDRWLSLVARFPLFARLTCISRSGADLNWSNSILIQIKEP
jgi:hypothetical protein